MVLLLAPLFDTMIDFKDYIDNIKTFLTPWLQNVVILTNPTPPKKKKKNSRQALPIAPLIEIGVKLASKCDL